MQEKKTTAQQRIISDLTEYEMNQAKFARHRALIMQILRQYPNGLTTQEIVAKELSIFGYCFLTDNRLRELREIGWVQSFDKNPMRWRVI